MPPAPATSACAPAAISAYGWAQSATGPNSPSAPRKRQPCATGSVTATCTRASPLHPASAAAPAADSLRPPRVGGRSTRERRGGRVAAPGDAGRVGHGVERDGVDGGRRTLDGRPSRWPAAALPAPGAALEGEIGDLHLALAPTPDAESQLHRAKVAQCPRRRSAAAGSARRTGSAGASSCRGPARAPQRSARPGADPDRRAGR